MLLLVLVFSLYLDLFPILVAAFWIGSNYSWVPFLKLFHANLGFTQVSFVSFEFVCSLNSFVINEFLQTRCKTKPHPSMNWTKLNKL